MPRSVCVTATKIDGHAGSKTASQCAERLSHAVAVLGVDEIEYTSADQGLSEGIKLLGGGRCIVNLCLRRQEYGSVGGVVDESQKPLFLQAQPVLRVA